MDYLQSPDGNTKGDLEKQKVCFLQGYEIPESEKKAERNGKTNAILSDE